MTSSEEGKEHPERIDLSFSVLQTSGKKKIIGGFRNELPQRNLSYTIREDRPPNPEFKRFKEEARKLNNKLQQEADRESKTVNKSYSARDTGLVLFVLRNGKWQQSEE